MSRPPVVIVGLDCPTGLQAARVFSERGIDVIGIAQNLRHPCVRTRHVRSIMKGAPGPEGVADTLVSLAAVLEGRAVIIPCTDLAVLGISRHRDRLPDRFLVAHPSPDVIEMLLDKVRFAAFAGRHGLPVPTTRVVRTRDDLARAGREIGFPSVLKPGVKTVEWDANVSAKAFVVETPEALFDAYDRSSRWADAFVLQQWIEGADSDHYTCDCYISASGEPLVAFTARKLRHWPPEAGQASLSVECRNDVVREEALRTFAAAGHRGQGYVEMKLDARSGRHVILEANVGRPTGRSATAERAGVELLMTVYCDLTDAPLPEQREQQYRGVKWMHLRRDLQACTYLLSRRRTTVGEILRSWSGPFQHALLSLRDPVPFLADVVGVGRGVLLRDGRARRRHVSYGVRRKRLRAPGLSGSTPDAEPPRDPRLHAPVAHALPAATHPEASDPKEPPAKTDAPSQKLESRDGAKHRNGAGSRDPMMALALAAAGLMAVRAAPVLASFITVE